MPNGDFHTPLQHIEMQVRTLMYVTEKCNQGSLAILMRASLDSSCPEQHVGQQVFCDISFHKWLLITFFIEPFPTSMVYTPPLMIWLTLVGACAHSSTHHSECKVILALCDIPELMQTPVHTCNRGDRRHGTHQMDLRRCLILPSLQVLAHPRAQ